MSLLTAVTLGACSQTPPSGAEGFAYEGSGTVGETADTSDTGSTGDGPDLGICARYLDCVAMATPEVTATTKALYGQEGSCWDLPGVSESDCHAECRALLRTTVETHPDAEECWECETNGDCTPEMPYCYMDKLCAADDLIESCDVWETSSACYAFGEGWDEADKESICAELDTADGFEPGTSQKTTPCKSENAVGRCDYVESLVDEPASWIYYLDGGTPYLDTTEAEEVCASGYQGEWVDL